LEKLSNISWFLLTFIHAKENGHKLGKLHPELLQKYTVFNQVFLGPKRSVLMKFCLISFCLLPKSFASNEYHSYLRKSCMNTSSIQVPTFPPTVPHTSRLYSNPQPWDDEASILPLYYPRWPGSGIFSKFAIPVDQTWDLLVIYTYLISLYFWATVAPSGRGKVKRKN
jgi:hypothetical protein